MEALETESAIRDWIFGARWAFLRGTLRSWALALNIEGERVRMSFQAGVNARWPREA